MTADPPLFTGQAAHELSRPQESRGLESLGQLANVDLGWNGKEGPSDGISKRRKIYSSWIDIMPGGWSQ